MRNSHLDFVTLCLALLYVRGCGQTLLTHAHPAMYAVPTHMHAYLRSAISFVLKDASSSASVARLCPGGAYMLEVRAEHWWLMVHMVSMHA